MCLLDAGVPMKNLVSSISCVVADDGEILLDPTIIEIKVGFDYSSLILGFKIFSLFCVW
jgi:ribonuclease PH